MLINGRDIDIFYVLRYRLHHYFTSNAAGTHIEIGTSTHRDSPRRNGGDGGWPNEPHVIPTPPVELYRRFFFFCFRIRSGHFLGALFYHVMYTQINRR